MEFYSRQQKLVSKQQIAVIVVFCAAAVLLTAALVAFADWAPAGGQAGAGLAQAGGVGLDKLDKFGCAGCHEAAVKSWNLTPHRRTVGAPQLKEDQQGCAGCHKGIEKHLQDASAYQPVAVGKNARENTALCMSCHKGGKQALWHGSKHSRLKEACLTCHDPHQTGSRYMLRKEEPELCAECHAQQVAEGQLPFHHPIAEGKMVCSDCHNVHGDQRGNLGRETNAEVCYRCHAEKAGPFRFEHPPVTEDCTTCHRPHGSPNENLLQVEQPLLCLQCHPGHHDSHRTPIVALDPANTAQTLAGINDFYQRCTSCHSLIHGTDLPSGTGNGTLMPGGPASPTSSTEADRGGAMLGVAGLTLGANLMDGAGREYFGFAAPWVGTEDNDGSPQFVRQYDGKDYRQPQLDSQSVLMSAHDMLTVRTESLGADDQEVDVYYANPRTSVDLNYQELTHRLGRFDFGPDTFIPSSDGGTQAVTHTDLTNGFDRFEIDRATAAARFSYRTEQFPTVRWNLGFWSEREKGKQQFLFLDRCGACHKLSTTQEIDRLTSEVSMGADVALGSSGLSYSHRQLKFENEAPEQFHTFSGLFGVFDRSAPLFGVADNVSNYDELRFSAPLRENFYLNGSYRRGDRENRFSDTNLGIVSAGGNATYYMRDDLQLSAGYFASTLNSEAAEGVDRKLRRSRFDLSYLGVRNLDLGIGFRREEVDRGSPHELAPRSSDSDIWSASAAWRPEQRLNLRAQYRMIDTDHQRNEDLTAPVDFLPSRYIGNPSEGRNWQVMADYLAGQQLSLTGLISRVQDEWKVSEFGESRDSSRDIKTAGLSVSYLPTHQARFSAGYYRQEGETNAEVTYGAEDFVLGLSTFPPIESTAEYNYDASILMLRGDYALNPRWRLFGTVNRTQSDGKVVARDLGDYIDQDPDLNGVDLILNPFDITVFDWWFGVGYRLDTRNEVTLSHQFRKWENDDDRAQDGSLRVWRLGWQHQF